MKALPTLTPNRPAPVLFSALLIFALATFASPGLAQTFSDQSSVVDDSGSGLGVAWGDFDGDGDPDLYISNSGQANRLFRNDGGTWVDATSSPLDDTGPGSCAAWGDYDNDGDLDLYLANYGTANRLFRNDGGTWVDATSGPLGDTANGYGVTWADYDNDGDLDIYLSNEGQANRLFRNDAGTWVDAASGALADTGPSRGAAWGDYDNDGDLDLYLANAGSANRFFRNDGGALVDATSGPLGDAGSGSGVAWGDYDNDGDLDIYLSNLGGANKLFRNDDGTWVDATSAPLDDAGPGTSVAWADVDNDGDLDLYLANFGSSNRLFRNDGGSWVDATTGPLGDPFDAAGAAWGDYDGDGDLDLYIAAYGSPNKLLRNDTVNGNHWLQVDLEGTLSNRDGVGARVELTAGGSTRIREVSAGSGVWSQNARTVSFGLGGTSIVDELVVRWPSGLVQLGPVPSTVDSVFTVTESPGLIASVTDIDGDQGGWVRVGIDSPGNDRAGEPLSIQTYYLWRRVDSPPLAQAIAREGVVVTNIEDRVGTNAEVPSLAVRSAGAEPAPAGMSAAGLVLRSFGEDLYAVSNPAAADGPSLPVGTWEVVGSAPGIRQPTYLISSPTLADSTAANGVFWSVFVVTAHTVVPGRWFPSDPDSGYSTDDIAPGVPSGFAASYGQGIVDLSWNESPAVDFQFFRVYRSTDPGFVPGPASLVRETSATSWQDTPADPGAVFYKLTALDHAGNESPAAASGAVTAVTDGPVAPSIYALRAATPNPLRSGTRIVFDLPVDSAVSLDVFDVSGRLVRTLARQSMPAGTHEANWDGSDETGRKVAAGVYLYRLRAGDFSSTRRMVVLR